MACIERSTTRQLSTPRHQGMLRKWKCKMRTVNMTHNSPIIYRVIGVLKQVDQTDFIQTFNVIQNKLRSQDTVRTIEALPSQNMEQHLINIDLLHLR